MLLNADRSCLLVVDIQERLLPVMADASGVVANTVRLIEGAERLRVPLLASLQYPKGLGPLSPDIAARVGAERRVEKVAFSCLGEPLYVARLEALGRPQAVVCGIETHICVLQTAMQLKARGYHPFVVADAVSSRRRESHDLALYRLAHNGIEVVTTEMVLFEWLGRAGTPVFKEISALVK